MALGAHHVYREIFPACCTLSMLRDTNHFKLHVVVTIVNKIVDDIHSHIITFMSHMLRNKISH